MKKVNNRKIDCDKINGVSITTNIIVDIITVTTKIPAIAKRE